MSIFDPTKPASIARSLKRVFVVALGVAAFSLPTFALASDTSTPTLTIPGIKKQSGGDDDPFSTAHRKAKPWMFSLGYYYADTSIVTTDGLGDFSTTSPQTGAELAIGYRVPFESGEGRVVLRGTGWTYDDGFSNTDTVSLSDVEFSVLFRAKAFYAGVGIDYISGTDSGNIYIPVGGGSSEALFSQTLGYDFSPTSFVEFHFHYTSTYPAYSGGSISYGIRF